MFMGTIPPGLPHWRILTTDQHVKACLPLIALCIGNVKSSTVGVCMEVRIKGFDTRGFSCHLTTRCRHFMAQFRLRKTEKNLWDQGDVHVITDILVHSVWYLGFHWCKCRALNKVWRPGISPTGITVLSLCYYSRQTRHYITTCTLYWCTCFPPPACYTFHYPTYSKIWWH